VKTRREGGAGDGVKLL